MTQNSDKFKAKLCVGAGSTARLTKRNGRHDKALQCSFVIAWLSQATAMCDAPLADQTLRDHAWHQGTLLAPTTTVSPLGPSGSSHVYIILGGIVRRCETCKQDGGYIWTLCVIFVESWWGV